MNDKVDAIKMIAVWGIIFVLAILIIVSIDHDMALAAALVPLLVLASAVLGINIRDRL